MTAEGRRKAMVVFAETDAGEDQTLPRSERHKLRQAQGEAQRSELITALEDAGMAGEAAVPEASPSSSILIEATPRALEAVAKAPNVERVLPIAEDAQMDVIE